VISHNRLETAVGVLGGVLLGVLAVVTNLPEVVLIVVRLSGSTGRSCCRLSRSPAGRRATCRRRPLPSPEATTVSAGARAAVVDSVYKPYGKKVRETTTVRVARATREELRRLAAHREESVADTVARAVRLLRQDEMGQELARPLTDEEVAWLDADAG